MIFVVNSWWNIDAIITTATAAAKHFACNYKRFISVNSVLILIFRHFQGFKLANIDTAIHAILRDDVSNGAVIKWMSSDQLFDIHPMNYVVVEYSNTLFRINKRTNFTPHGSIPKNILIILFLDLLVPFLLSLLSIFTLFTYFLVDFRKFQRSLLNLRLIL